MLTSNLAWQKCNGLIPAIIQHAVTQEVLMCAFMNEAALKQTLATQLITFYSRSKQRLWVKGESSGHHLKLISICTDCDNDTLLIQAEPMGPVCHKGTATCFAENGLSDWKCLHNLEHLIHSRKQQPLADSYTSELFNQGISRIAQKIGEEGVEVALAAVSQDNTSLCGEAADLLYHLFVLLKARDLEFSDVIDVLKNRQLGNIQ